MRFKDLVLAFAIFALFIIQVQSGPIAYGICQAGCAGVVVACYSAAGFVFGNVLAVGASPAIIACNTAYGSCQAACAVVAFAPTP
ncbi:hypothetical protein Q7P37_007819 [Cladosporium fusiforme]